MIDLDIYYPNKAVEEFLEKLKVKFNKTYPTVKVYISTANPYDHWLKIKEEQKDEIYTSKT